MALGFVQNRGNIKIAAIDSWYVRALGGATTLKYSFTADFTSDTLTVVGNPFSNTNTVQVRAGAGDLPSGLTEYPTYFVINVVANVFQLSLTQGGAAVSLVDNGTAPNYIFYADSGHYQLPDLNEGKVIVKSISLKDSHGRNKGYGASLEASAKILSTGKTHVLKVLDSLASMELDHVINTQSGSINNFGLSDRRFGTKWKFVCDSDSDKNRYIELTCTRLISKAETTALLTTAAPSYGVADPDDVLYPLAAITAADIIPAGFATFKVCDTYNGSFLDIGEILNGKLTVELLTTKNSLGCEVGYALKIDVSVEAMQASTTELALLQALSSATMFYKITLLDGTVFTLASSGGSQLGIDWEFDCSKDSDGISFLRYTGTGIILSPALDAIFA